MGVHLTRRMPHNRNGFCWARIPQDSGSVLYRLYRRDTKRATHAVLRNFQADCSRHFIAQELNIARPDFDAEEMASYRSRLLARLSSCLGD